jgi:hypothetical protein
MKRLRLALAVALSSLGLLPAAREPAETPPPSEYEVKAAYLYHFAKFVTWPPDAADEPGSFVITLLGEDPFGAALDAVLRGKTIDGKQVLVRRAPRVADVGRSQILFVSASESGRLPAILDALEAAPGTLTVGDMDGFAARGGVIGFRLEGNRIRLDVSLAAAERARLRISSQLLRLARIVDARGAN